MVSSRFQTFSDCRVRDALFALITYTVGVKVALASSKPTVWQSERTNNEHATLARRLRPTRLPRNDNG